LDGEEIKSYTVNPPDFRNAISNETDFYVQFHVFTPEVDALITKIIHRYLEKYDILYLKDTVITITKELINNAIKANLKRLYFRLNKLDIKKTEDYRTGMETFKLDTFQTGSEIIEKLNNSNLVARVSFKTTENHIHLNIINNIPILDVELKKINARIKKAYKYTDISDAFDDVLDESEGAGLGLIMAMMLFKNSGMPAESFKIYRKGELTISTLTIPKSLIAQESSIEVTDRIIKEIEEIPAFPENIMQIQKLCSNPDATMREIAGKISLDPGLTTSILKLANSAGYITIKKVESIEEAVKIIGIKGINTLLLATGVHKVIDSRYKRFEVLWRNSYRRAFYAQKIAIQLKKTKISEFVYLSALLSDIGKMVMLSLEPDLIKNLTDLAGTKGLEDSNLLEEISLGISHSTLGAMICRKWKFNESLVKTIEYRRRPHMSPENIKALVYIVYIADVFVEVENRKSRYEIIDEDVLEYFNIRSLDDFNLLHNILKETYTSQMNIENKI